MKKRKEKASQARLTLEGRGVSGIVDDLNKKFGSSTALLMQDLSAGDSELRRIPTGVAELDVALGGGIPENRIMELRGNFSTLKSTLSLKIGGNFQRKYEEGVLLIVDMERTYSPSYAESLGVDPSRTIILLPDSGDQACQVLLELFDLSVPVFVVVDSIAHMTPEDEIEKGMDQAPMAGHARMINKFMRIASAKTKRALYDRSQPSITVLAINQLRDKVGVVYGSPETTTGGKGKDYAYSLIIKLISGGVADRVFREETRNGRKRQIRCGQTVHFRLEKDKCGHGQFAEGQFTYYIKAHERYAKGQFDNDKSLLNLGVFYGVISLTGNTYEYDCIKEVGKEAFCAALLKDDVLMGDLTQQIIEKMQEEETTVGEEEQEE